MSRENKPRASARKDERIRVLHVVPYVLMGGVERRRVLLARHLGDAFEQHVACFTARGEVYEALAATGVGVHALSYKGGGFKDWRAHYRLHALVRELRPHIVHAAIFPGMVWGGVAGLVHRVPLVLLEETSSPEPSAPRERQRSYAARAVVRALAMSTGGIVAVAPAIRDFLMGDHALPAHKVHLVLNGVGDFTPASDAEVSAERLRRGIPEGAFVVGNACRLDDSHKRLSDLIEAVKRLRERHDVRALIVGDGRDREKLERRAAELGVSDAVVFTGRWEERRLFYPMMDAFVLSSATEAAPLGLMEAMAAGRPCVATTVGGVRDITEDGRAALLVPPYRVDELTLAIEKLVVDPALRRSISEAARERGRYFGAERYASDVARLYRTLLAERGVAVQGDSNGAQRASR